MPSKLSMLLDQKLTLNDLPIVEPVDAGRLRDYLVASAPPTPTREQVESMIGRLAIAMPIRAKRERRRRTASTLVLKHDREWRPADEDFVTVQDVAALLASMRVGGNIVGGLNG